jgi:hypothetical protein
MHKLYYRIGAETKEELVIEDLFSTTLEELKTDIAARTGFDGKRLRLVKAGKVLQGDPDMTLESLGLEDGDTIYVARLASNSISSPSQQDSQQAPISGSLLRTAADNQDAADPMAQLFDNPLIQSMFSNSDLMSSLLESDPRIAQMAEVIFKGKYQSISHTLGVYRKTLN